LTSAPIAREGLLPFTDAADEEQLVERALVERPDIALVQRGARAFDAQAEQLRREVIPEPVASVGTYITHLPHSGSLVASVAVPLPLFDRNQGAIGRATSEARAQRARAAALQGRAAAGLRAALRNQRRARDAMARFRERA